ncbi:MAG: hypothetical protein D6698_03350 [Gammaproteobacteria bacterium]|nr:MAG: hypothetical protein D6698_03350 [Gammaproteobacteria bacterium]
MLHQITFPQNLDLGDEDYAFCAGKDCSAGYFSESRQIPKTSLRAFQPGCDEMLCYCFDISVSTYRTALSEGTAKLIREFVIQNTKKDLCVCMTRNPSGRCCLADFKRMEHDHDH